MANLRNSGRVIGRLTKDPVIFTNKDGSRKIMITIAARDNFKAKDGSTGTQFVPVEAFVPANKQGNGVYDYMSKGHMVGVEYEVRNNNYKDKDGKDHYEISLLVQTVDLMEPKKTNTAQATEATVEPEQEDLPFN